MHTRPARGSCSSCGLCHGTGQRLKQWHGNQSLAIANPVSALPEILSLPHILSLKMKTGRKHPILRMFSRSKTKQLRKRANASRYQKPWKQRLFLSFIFDFSFAERFSGYPPVLILRKFTRDPRPVSAVKSCRDLNRPWGQ